MTPYETIQIATHRSEVRAWIPPQRLGGITWDAPTGPDLRPSRTPSRTSWEVREAWRRGLNITAAIALLVVFAVPMLVIALLVKATSRGPVLYKQARVGIDRRRGRGGRLPESLRVEDKGGRVFQVYKFRTMRHEEGQEDTQVWAAKNDPRITAVGRLLRAYRLDELPQLFNVLKGDMNVVGPRPEQPEIFKELREKVDGYQHRQRVLPGITGWAQVNHHYDQCVEDVKRKLEYDLDYISRRSPLEDLMIMTRTPVVMVLKQGSR